MRLIDRNKLLKKNLAKRGKSCWTYKIAEKKRYEIKK